MDQLKLSIIQANLIWENAQKNRHSFERKIEAIKQTDLILLPEMFSTGFTMNTVQYAEEMEGKSMEWMHKMAKQKKAVVCGSLIIREKNHYFNRLIWMKNDGSYETYDKRHLFRMANEDDHFTSGKKRLVVELNGWKICPLVCYDLRFPVWSRNQFETDRKTYAEASYDLLIYIANWPKPRVEAWEKLLYARAIENQCYVAGVNRIGTDDNQVEYNGGSLLIDAKGSRIWKAKNEEEKTITLSISKKELKDFRTKFPVGMDGDKFDLKE